MVFQNLFSNNDRLFKKAFSSSEETIKIFQISAEETTQNAVTTPPLENLNALTEQGLSEHFTHSVAENVTAHANRVFPPFDFSYAFSHVFWLLISFGIFYFFISRVIAPRIGDIIETREGRIASDFDYALRLKQEADEMVSLYEKSLEEARLRAKKISAEAEENMKAKFDKERKENEAILAEKIAESQKNIALQSHRAIENLEETVKSTAQDIVQKILGVNLSESSIIHALKDSKTN